MVHFSLGGASDDTFILMEFEGLVGDLTLIKITSHFEDQMLNCNSLVVL